MRKLLCLLPLFMTAAVRADSPNPLSLVPDKANLVVRIEKPRLLVESVVHHELFAELKQLPFVREQLQSQGVQRFLQLIQYYEDDLGVKWPEMLDKLAGHGITLATSAGDDNAPVLIIIHGTDPEFTKKFYQMAVTAIEREIAREDAKAKPEKVNYRGIDGIKVGDALLVPIGPNFYFSNNKEAMHLAIDLHLDKKKSLADKAGPAAAKKALPADPLAWLWFDLEAAHNAPNAKAAYAVPSDNVVQMLAAGSTLNAIGRAPFLAAALIHEKDTFLFTVRLPGGGREGMPEGLALHVPPKGYGTLPLLEPKGVIVSHNLYLDPKALWELRGKLFNEMIAADFEKGVKKGNPLVPGGSLEKLFANSGPYHRFVAVERPHTGYAIKPEQHIPPFAIVTQMRDPQFGKSAEGVIRGIALLAGGQFRPKLTDEMHGNIKLVGYRFSEDGTVPDDPTNLRFNFSPCFAVVGNQFMACSTIEFGREMIAILQKESEGSPAPGHPATLRTKFHAAGGVELLRTFEDQLLGQIILDQAVKPAEAKKQAAQLLNWFARLGTLEIRTGYEDREYRLDIEWKTK
jgi:hypothetical protein